MPQMPLALKPRARLELEMVTFDLSGYSSRMIKYGRVPRLDGYCVLVIGDRG